MMVDLYGKLNICIVNTTYIFMIIQKNKHNKNERIKRNY